MNKNWRDLLYRDDACIRTPSGRYVDLLEPQADTIILEDIAWGLAHAFRFRGNSYNRQRPITVAEHSYMVARDLSANKVTAKVGLLHDAAEAYLGDVPSPIKKYLGNYNLVEEKLLEVIYSKFGISSETVKEHWDKVKESDAKMLEMEFREIVLEGAKEGKSSVNAYYEFLEAAKLFL